MGKKPLTIRQFECAIAMKEIVEQTPGAKKRDVISQLTTRGFADTDIQAALKFATKPSAQSRPAP